MNLLKPLRKSSFICFASLLFLFFSCSQYEPIRKAQRELDYKLYEAFQKQPDLKIDYSSFQNGRMTTEEINQALLDAVNEHYGTDVTLPHIMLGFTDKTKEEIYDLSLENGYITIQDKNIIDGFVNDLEITNFDSALSNFEENIINIDITETEFSKYETFANYVKIMNNENPQLFLVNQQGRDGGWACIGAIVGLIAGIIGLLSCATIILCGIAYVGFMIAVAGMSACNTNA